MAEVSRIPSGYHTLTTYITLKNATEALEFYKQAFGAVEAFRLIDPRSGKIGHAEIRIGNSYLMLSDEYPDFGAISPQTLGGNHARLHLYVEDVDTFVQQAVDAGATILRPLRNEFYGDRCALLADPFGYSWQIATHIEDVTPEEMQRRFDSAY